MAGLLNVRDALAAQLRAQYDTGQGGSGSWDDAGFDRAAELADLLIKAGVTDLGDLSFVDTEFTSPGTEGGYRDSGDSTVYEGPTPESKYTKRQLKIGDKTVGYLGDYNNDGSYGNKRDDYLQSGNPGENLLAWSARGDGNTSYRIIEDPDTGKLVITPGWNSSSDAAKVRRAAIATAAMVAGGYGAAALAGAGAAGAGGAAAAGAGAGAGSTTLGLTSAQWAAAQAAALKGAAFGAGTNTIRQLSANGWDLDEVNAKDVLKAGAIGGAAGGIGSAAGAYAGSGTVGQVAGGAARTALNGGSGEDIFKGALLSGATGMADNYLKTDIGLDAGTRGAVIGGGRALIGGGGTDDVLRSALTGYAGGVGRNDSGPADTGSTQRTSNMSTYDDIDWGETLDYSQFTGGDSDPIYDAYNDPSRDLDTLSNNGLPDDTDPSFFDMKELSKYFSGAFSTNGGKINVGGVDFSGGDLLKLLAAGVSGVTAGRAAEKAGEKSDERWRQERQWQVDDKGELWLRQDKQRSEDREYQLDDRGALWERQDSQRAEDRSWQLDDKGELWMRQDKQRAEDRGWQTADRAEERQWQLDDRTYLEDREERLRNEKFQRMRPVSGLLAPKLVKVGG